MTNLDAFDNYALEYDKWFENHELEYALELKAIREFLPKGGGGIEIGSGTGRFTQPLGISLGVEPSEAMRNVAINRGVNVIAGSAESLPVVDNLYNFALLVTTVCFLEAPELAINEAYRVLKADGLIIIGLIDKNSNLGKEYEEKKGESKFYKDANFHSVVEIKEKLKESGFFNIKCIQAILPGDTKENYTPGVKQGYGEGSFVVLQAQKHDA